MCSCDLCYHSPRSGTATPHSRRSPLRVYHLRPLTTILWINRIIESFWSIPAPQLCTPTEWFSELQKIPATADALLSLRLQEQLDTSHSVEVVETAQKIEPPSIAIAFIRGYFDEL